VWLVFALGGRRLGWATRGSFRHAVSGRTFDLSNPGRNRARVFCIHGGLLRSFLKNFHGIRSGHFDNLRLRHSRLACWLVPARSVAFPVLLATLGVDGPLF